MLAKESAFDFAYKGYQYPLPPSWKYAIRQQDQIEWLLQALLMLNDEALSEDKLENIKAELTKQLADLSAEDKARLEAAVSELNRRIDDFAKGFDIWNVTSGAYTQNVQSMREFFNDVTVHSLTVDELASLDITVDGLADSGLNVRGLAVFSGYLEGDEFKPEGVFYKAPADAKLTAKILATGVVKDGYFMAASEED